MKRVGNLWSGLIAFENLLRAAYQVLRGKRGQVQAGCFFQNLEEELFRLRQELASHSYEPGYYRTFWISDPKPRLISAAPFRDRVVHHALVNVIEPVFERRFIHDSYACRRRKGTHRALRRFVCWARSTRFALKMDIRKFFPSIDHHIMKETVRQAVKDREVLWLCDLIIDCSNDQERVSHYFPGDDLFAPLGRRRGIPIGNLTSQFFANVYLDPLDHFIKERLRARRYLRYVDDLCCFDDDKSRLKELRAEIAEFLMSLRLKLHEGKSRVRRLKEGVEFLGFVVLPDRLRLNHRAVERQRRRLKRLQWGFSAGCVSILDIEASMVAWCAHAAHGDTWTLRQDISRKTVFVRGARPRRVA